MADHTLAKGGHGRTVVLARAGLALRMPLVTRDVPLPHRVQSSPRTSPNQPRTAQTVFKTFQGRAQTIPGSFFSGMRTHRTSPEPTKASLNGGRPPKTHPRPAEGGP